MREHRRPKRISHTATKTSRKKSITAATINKKQIVQTARTPRQAKPMTPMHKHKKAKTKAQTQHPLKQKHQTAQATNPKKNHAAPKTISIRTKAKHR